MSQQFLEEILGEWVELAAHACRDVPSDLLWGGWSSYDWHIDLECTEFIRGGEEIHFRRPGYKKSSVVVGNIHPTGEVIGEQVVTLPQGAPVMVDGATIPVENFYSPVPLPFHYTGDFGKTRGHTKGEALAIGFTESIEIGVKFAQGSGGLAKSEQTAKIGFEARQDKTETDEKSEGESALRSAGISPVCPGGYDIEYSIARTTQSAKQRRSGKAAIGFSLTIGKHWSGHWKKKHGKHDKYYPRHLHWDSEQDFLETIQGNGRRDFAAATFFRKNPAPAWLIAKLKALPDVPYSAETLAFDDWTKFRPRAKVLRINPAIVKLSDEVEDEDED